MNIDPRDGAMTVLGPVSAALEADLREQAR